METGAALAVATICGDKILTSLALKDHGVPQPELRIAFTEDDRRFWSPPDHQAKPLEPASTAICWRRGGLVERDGSLRDVVRQRRTLDQFEDQRLPALSVFQ